LQQKATTFGSNSCPSRPYLLLVKLLLQAGLDHGQYLLGPEFFGLMAREQHSTAHDPHPLHRASFIFDLKTPGLTSTMFGAPYSQSSSHLPQAMHFSSSTTLTTPSASMKSFERTVLTLAAAARACETLSR